MSAPSPTDFKPLMAGVFDRAAATYDQLGPRFFAHFGRRLVEIAQLAPGANVLDIATGRGAILFPAARQVGPAGYVLGIDLAEGMVAETAARLRELAVANATVRQMDAEHLDFGGASFDAVLCGFALFFFPDPERLLVECQRVLKPGGCLALTTWGRDDERWAWLGELQQKYAPPQFRKPPAGRLAFNQPEAMRAAMERAGLAEVRVIEEAADFVYADEEEWLAVQWSHGMRASLEMMSPPARDQMLSEAFARLRAMKRPEGIPHRLYALCSLGVKP